MGAQELAGHTQDQPRAEITRNAPAKTSTVGPITQVQGGSECPFVSEPMICVAAHARVNIYTYMFQVNLRFYVNTQHKQKYNLTIRDKTNVSENQNIAQLEITKNKK